MFYSLSLTKSSLCAHPCVFTHFSALGLLLTHITLHKPSFSPHILRYSFILHSQSVLLPRLPIYALLCYFTPVCKTSLRSHCFFRHVHLMIIDRATVLSISYHCVVIVRFYFLPLFSFFSSFPLFISVFIPVFSQTTILPLTNGHPCVFTHSH